MKCFFLLLMLLKILLCVFGSANKIRLKNEFDERKSAKILAIDARREGKRRTF